MRLLKIWTKGCPHGPSYPCPVFVAGTCTSSFNLTWKTVLIFTCLVFKGTFLNRSWGGQGIYICFKDKKSTFLAPFHKCSVQKWCQHNQRWGGNFGLTEWISVNIGLFRTLFNCEMLLIHHEVLSCACLLCFVVLQMKTNQFGFGMVGEILDDQVKIYYWHMWQLKSLIRFVRGVFSNILSTYSFCYLQCYVLNSTGPSTALH